MARKKAQKEEKQETTLVPHRTPNLSALLEQAKTGDSAQALKAFLDAGGSPMAAVRCDHSTGMLQFSLLHCVALTNSHPHKELAESVRLLVAAGANINARSADLQGEARPVLMSAAEQSCCAAVLDTLLRAGADPFVLTTGCLTPLHMAVRAGPVESCELLLAAAETLLDAEDNNGRTALMHAAQCGRSDIVQLLLQKGAAVNVTDSQESTPLSVATWYLHVEVAACLIAAGADVNAVNSDGRSALMLAAQFVSIPLAKLLLDHGADINKQDRFGQNSLFRAACDGHVSMMELLVQRGCSITAVDHKGYTPLMEAASWGHTAAAEWLLQQGAAVDVMDDYDNTALHFACYSSSGDNAATIEALLANGAEVHKCNSYSGTALDEAAYYGSVQCAKVLIPAGAIVNRINYDGQYALHTAIRRNHAAVVQLLLEHGATAAMNSVVPVVCLDGTDHCCTQTTALMLCTTVDTVKVLLAAGADVHVTTAAGNTCLHVAAYHSYTAPVLYLLIKAGADLHAVNNSDKLAAQLAHDRDNVLIEQLLIRAAQQER
jgi:uncharacterized protein